MGDEHLGYINEGGDELRRVLDVQMLDEVADDEGCRGSRNAGRVSFVRDPYVRFTRSGRCEACRGEEGGLDMSEGRVPVDRYYLNQLNQHDMKKVISSCNTDCMTFMKEAFFSETRSTRLFFM